MCKFWNSGSMPEDYVVQVNKPRFQSIVRGIFVSMSKNLNSLRPVILFEISPKNVRPGSQGTPPPAGIGLKTFKMAKKSHFLGEKNKTLKNFFKPLGASTGSEQDFSNHRVIYSPPLKNIFFPCGRRDPVYPGTSLRILRSILDLSM